MYGNEWRRIPDVQVLSAFAAALVAERDQVPALVGRAVFLNAAAGGRPFYAARRKTHECILAAEPFPCSQPAGAGVPGLRSVEVLNFHMLPLVSSRPRGLRLTDPPFNFSAVTHARRKNLSRSAIETLYPLCFLPHRARRAFAA